MCEGSFDAHKVRLYLLSIREDTNGCNLSKFGCLLYQKMPTTFIIANTKFYYILSGKIIFNFLSGSVI